MKTVKRVLLITLAVMLLFCSPALAKSKKLKSYKAKKVTASQIVGQLTKKVPVTNVIGVSKKTHPDLAPMFDHPNEYKTKINFTDKNYPSVYCSVEVFRDKYDAATRKAELSATTLFYDLLGMTTDFPTLTYRYKNVLIRLNDDMPTAYALNYFKYLKKIVK